MSVVGDLIIRNLNSKFKVILFILILAAGGNIRSFGQLCPAAPLGYQYQKTFEINGSKVGGVLVNFPVLVNLTNPKAIIFIGALVPQFIDPGRSQVEQYLLIAATLCLTDIVVMSAYALAAGRLGSWLHDPKAIRLQNRAFGGLFISAGTLLALSSRSP